MTKVSAKYDLRKYFRKILKKKSTFFYPLEISLEPKSCFCSIYHNFVINEYFDLNQGDASHMRVALRTVFGVTPRVRNRFLG